MLTQEKVEVVPEILQLVDNVDDMALVRGSLKIGMFK